MIRVSGPSNEPTYFLAEKGTPPRMVENPFSCEAKTLRDALNAYCGKYGSTIRPYDGSLPDVPLKDGERKYFFYFDPTSRFGEILVDIHIIRKDASEICPKQDLDFPLEHEDEVSIGTLVC